MISFAAQNNINVAVERAARAVDARGGKHFAPIHMKRIVAAHRQLRAHQKALNRLQIDVTRRQIALDRIGQDSPARIEDINFDVGIEHHQLTDFAFGARAQPGVGGEIGPQQLFLFEVPRQIRGQRPIELLSDFFAVTAHREQGQGNQK